MAVKEEKYDPGYEAAYGGAYNENPYPGELCGFSSDGLGMSPPPCLSLSKTWFCHDWGKEGFLFVCFKRELITEEWEWKYKNLSSDWGTSLVVQWLGYRLIVQRAGVQALVGELRSHMPCSQETKIEAIF